MSNVANNLQLPRILANRPAAVNRQKNNFFNPAPLAAGANPILHRPFLRTSYFLKKGLSV
jgi:hypothetical protein